MYLYIVYNKKTKLTKIGITENLDRRLSQIEHACGCKINLVFQANINHASETEKFLHATFNSCRVKGEWFSLKKHHVEYLRTFLFAYFDSLIHMQKEDAPFAYELMTTVYDHQDVVFHKAIKIDDECYNLSYLPV